MKKIIFTAICLFSIASYSEISKNLLVKVSLFPAGSFEINTKMVNGLIEKKGDKVTAPKISSKVKTFETGIELRDEHTKKRFELDKYPTVEVVDAEGKDGKGEGTIIIKGIKKRVSFTYKELDSSLMEVNFSLKLKDFEFKDINYMGVGVEDEVKVVATLPFKNV